MIALRKDYILDQWVVISEKRGKRPNEFKSTSELKPGAVDFFAPGNEHLTPPEIGRFPKKGPWQMRWFPNKFAAVEGSTYKKQSGSKLLQSMPAFGYHEVIVETRSKTKQLWELDAKAITNLIQIYNERIVELSKKKHIKYVQVFKNHGKEGGTSLIHSHTQVVALPSVPKAITEKVKGLKKNKTSYQTILKQELKTKRKAFETKHFGAICPYASRYNYEILIIPKKAYASLNDMPKEIIKDLGSILHKVLKKIKQSNWPYNMYVQYDPNKKMSFHIEITPRIATWAGFELSTGIIINSVSPENAAQYYRSK